MKTIIKYGFCLFVSVVVLLCSKLSFSQISLTSNLTANALTQHLVGPGIVYSNPTLTCPLNASGKFQNGNLSSINIDSGIILTTGRLQSFGAAVGVNGNASAFANVNNTTSGGDADLASSASGAINDLCKLEFDFVPTGDTIQFQYRFGSEEYPDYNCTQFNDIFAFYLSGLGYPTPTNLALVPGTNIPVTINSINSGVPGPSGALSNCTSLGAGSPFTSLYVNNGASTTITYDGLTTILTSKAAVTPCSTYHMKFAIADVIDHLYDSGVFLKAGSFTSDVASISNATSSNSLPSTGPFVIEGCNASVITISRPIAKPYAQIVTYTLGGTATLGVDYNNLTGTVTIPANATSTTISITAFADGITEGTESIIIYLNGSLCGGSTTDTLVIDLFEYPSYNIPQNATICLGQSINLNSNPTSANVNLGFTWSPSNGLSNTTGTNVIATPTTTTTYTLSSTYPGCTGQQNYFTITVDPIPVLNVTKTNITCNGANNGSISASSVVASLPATFSLMPTGSFTLGSPATFSNLVVNTYTVTVSSAIGCSSSSVVTITQPSPLLFTATSSTPVQCFGINNGTIATTAAGGTGAITYQITPGGFSNSTGNFTGLTSGTYTITATDANLCSSNTPVTINYLTQILFNTPIVTNVSPCFGGSNGAILLTTNGGISPYQYALNGGNVNTTGSYTNLPANTYTVSSTDANGCMTTSLVVVNQPSQVQVSAVNVSNVICNGQSNGSISVTANGGVGNYIYTLLPNNLSNALGIFNNVNANNYTIQVTDANVCSSTSNTNVSQPASITFNTFNISNVTCNGGSNGQIMCSAVGGTGTLQYTLLPNNTSNITGVFNAVSANNYTIVVTDANGCNTSTTFILNEPNPIVFNSPIISNVLCFGGNDGGVTQTATGGTGLLTYTISPLPSSNTSGTFLNLYAGIYTITATDISLCTSFTTVNIIEPNANIITGASIVNPTCINSTNGSITLLNNGGTPPYTYSIDGGPFVPNATFSNLAQGNYTITLKDANGCTESTDYILNPTNILNFNTISVSNVSCKYGNDGSITTSVSGGATPYTYTINGNTNANSSFFDTLTAGNYTIIVTDTAGCVADTLVTISEPNGILFIQNVVITNVSCKGGSDGTISISGIGGTPPYTFKLNNGAFQSSGTFTNIASGIHTVYIKDFLGCGNDTILYISEPALDLQLSLKNIKPQSCIGVNDGQISVGSIGGTQAYTYLFNGLNVNADSIYSNLQPGSYSVIVSDSKGCTSSNVFTIEPSTLRPIIQVSSIINPLCKGINNGVIDWFTTNTYPPYKYIFNGNFIDTISVQNNLTNIYYNINVKDDRGCTSDTSIKLDYRTVLQTKAIPTKASCDGVGNDGKIEISVNGGASPYLFSCSNGVTNSTTNIFSSLHFGNYVLFVEDNNSCKDTTSAEVEFIPCCEVYMPNAFTPNGDSKNNTFVYIPHGSIEIKQFDIYNRWGNLVFTSNIPNQAWDGNYKNEPAPSATYYYQIKYKCPLTNKILIEKGDVILIR